MFSYFLVWMLFKFFETKQKFKELHPDTLVKDKLVQIYLFYQIWHLVRMDTNANNRLASLQRKPYTHITFDNNQNITLGHFAHMVKIYSVFILNFYISYNGNSF